MALQYNNRLRGRTVKVLPASCPNSVVVTMGNCRHKVKVLDIPLGWGLVHKDGRKYTHQSFVATPKPGKCTVSTGLYQGPVARKSKPPPFPGSVGRRYELLVY